MICVLLIYFSFYNLITYKSEENLVGCIMVKIYGLLMYCYKINIKNQDNIFVNDIKHVISVCLKDKNGHESLENCINNEAINNPWLNISKKRIFVKIVYLDKVHVNVRNTDYSSIINDDRHLLDGFLTLNNEDNQEILNTHQHGLYRYLFNNFNLKYKACEKNFFIDFQSYYISIGGITNNLKTYDKFYITQINADKTIYNVYAGSFSCIVPSILLDLVSQKLIQNSQLNNNTISNPCLPAGNNTLALTFRKIIKCNIIGKKNKSYIIKSVFNVTKCVQLIESIIYNEMLCDSNFKGCNFADVKNSIIPPDSNHIHILNEIYKANFSHINYFLKFLTLEIANYCENGHKLDDYQINYSKLKTTCFQLLYMYTLFSNDVFKRNITISLSKKSFTYDTFLKMFIYGDGRLGIIVKNITANDSNKTVLIFFQ